MNRSLLSIGLIALLLCGAGCAPSAPSTPQSPPTPPSIPSRPPLKTQPPIATSTPASVSDLGVPVTFKIGQRVQFQDGIALMLRAISDSRCKPGVQCVWAGELGPIFDLIDTDQSQQEFTLGTVRALQLTVKQHVIKLDEASTSQATVTVSRP